jgi:coenzyme F420-reducing hydrogenase alpha subunit
MTAQKITIEPVTRIEGHAKVTIHMNDAGTYLALSFFFRAGSQIQNFSVLPSLG